MGLDKPKSLLPVHADGRTFLDLIVEQVCVLRRKFGAQVCNHTLSLTLTHYRWLCQTQTFSSSDTIAGSVRLRPSLWLRLSRWY